MMRFTLGPQLVIRNITEQQYEVHTCLGMHVTAQPMTETAADWRPSLERPEDLHLQFSMSSADDPQVDFSCCPSEAVDDAAPILCICKPSMPCLYAYS